MDQGNTMVFSSGDVYVGAPEKKSRKKWVIIGLVGVVAIGIVIAVVMLILGLNKKVDRGVAYDALWQLSDKNYNVLVDAYDGAVGFGGERDIEGWIFPVSEDRLNALKDMVSASMENYGKVNELSGTVDGVSDELNALLPIVKKNVGNTLASMEKNVSVLAQFYEAFIGPLYAAAEGGDIGVCTKTDKINVLLDTDDANVRTAAEKYYAVQCAMLNSMKNNSDRTEGPGSVIIGLADDAKKALRGCLINVDGGNSGLAELRQLLAGLSQ